jgi:RNAse (barnase) inhibitor barstar
MADIFNPKPKWYSFSHHDRFILLNNVKERWCKREYRKKDDLRNLIVHLNGSWINDVPSFYLTLGEAINGPNGYFGACLDALSDCLFGDFGVLPPLTIRLSHFVNVRNALDGRAWCRFRAEYYKSISDEGEDIEVLIDNGYLGDGSIGDISYWTAKYEAALAGESFAYDEFGSYFDTILDVLKERGAKLIPATEKGR